MNKKYILLFSLIAILIIIIPFIHQQFTKVEDTYEGSYIIVFKNENFGNPRIDYFSQYPDGIDAYLGKTIEEIKELFGESYLVIKHTNIPREFWVYMPNVGGELEGDSTGIYLCFEYGRLINLKLDEFNGIVEELAYTYLEW